MRGVVFPGDRKVAFENFDDPTPGPGEAVLEMKASGMCGSDLKFYRATAESGGPAALGLGELSGAGDRRPRTLRSGSGASPRQRRRRGSGRRPGYGAPLQGLRPLRALRHRLVAALPRRSGGLRRNRPWRTCALHAGAGVDPCPPPRSAVIRDRRGYQLRRTAFGALGRLELSGRDTIAIFGQGPVGLSATQLAAAMGARVIALDIGAERRALAEAMGAESVVDPGAVDPVEALRELTGGDGVDMALDCSGVSAAREAAARSTRVWGKVCFVGEGGGVTLDVSRDVLRKQLTIIGSWTFSRFGQAACARFVAEREINVRCVVQSPLPPRRGGASLPACSIPRRRGKASS